MCIIHRTDYFPPPRLLRNSAELTRTVESTTDDFELRTVLYAAVSRVNRVVNWWVSVCINIAVLMSWRLNVSCNKRSITKSHASTEVDRSLSDLSGRLRKVSRSIPTPHSYPFSCSTGYHSTRIVAVPRIHREHVGSWSTMLYLIRSILQTMRKLITDTNTFLHCAQQMPTFY